jgi:endothelin-converting enzyme/putative endopeptidase
MRCIRLVLFVVAFSCAVLAQSPQKGVEPADIDRKADPCNDFFQYANGAWRAANPIPASMQRWSRRWASGELAKDQLKEILDDASKKTDWPKGSIEQQIGDYYRACMNENG